jgi:type IV pilus assembly protein PilF
MRLHDARLVIGMALALCALAGCHRMSSRRTVDSRHETSLREEDNTPHRASQTDIALAEQYIEAGKYEIALDRLQHAVQLEPASADAYTMLGVLYERINRPAQAETSYAKSVKLAPDKGDILNNYGAWLCRSGHPLESDAWFRKALADPFYKTPVVALGNAAACALKAGKPELAESYDRQLLALDATNAGALQEIASTLHQRGDDLHARAFIERLLSASKATPEMLDLAARIEDKLGDNDAARGYRNRIATEFPQYTPSKR